MPLPSLEDRRPTITPQLAMRVAVLGGIAFALFAIVFFRLWFLQVLSGEDYVAQSRENRVRKVKIEAPRGDIVDRNGRRLVQTRAAPVVQVNPTLLPAAELELADEYRRARARAEATRLKAGEDLETFRRQLRADEGKATKAERRRLRRLRRAAAEAPPVQAPAFARADRDLRIRFRRLGRVLDMRASTIHERVVEGVAEAPWSNVTIKTDVDPSAFYFLKERAASFPGVVVEKQFLREYPQRKLGAQLFGTVGEIAPDQIGEDVYRGATKGNRVGQGGLEETYDRYLRGRDGYTRVVVDSTGNRDDERAVSRREPVQGQRLRLTLDLGLEKAADNALQRAVQAANANGNPSRAGAYVAMDPTNGAVLALGSYPSFDANEFAKPISYKRYDELKFAPGAPLFDRATDAVYPTGSIFKPFTALAALDSGILSTGQIINDTGRFEIGDQVKRNAKDAVYGPINLSGALKVSSDIFFYTLGEWANAKGPIIQRWAKRVGLGRRTGIDLPSDPTGLIPDADWRNDGYRRYLRCIKRAGLEQGSQAALFRCGGIDRPWSAGDNVNLAVGQGDLQASPLQMAVAYSALANGGKVVRPHIAEKVEDGEGRVVQELRASPRRRVKLDPGARDAILDGLRRAAGEDDGTSADVMAGLAKRGITVYGKTGTVERGVGEPDQSWYACFVKDTARPIVVVVTVEKGGFGAETAAPAARLILSQWYRLGDKSFKAGSDTTR